MKLKIRNSLAFVLCSTLLWSHSVFSQNNAELLRNLANQIYPGGQEPKPGNDGALNQNTGGGDFGFKEFKIGKSLRELPVKNCKPVAPGFDASYSICQTKNPETTMGGIPVRVSRLLSIAIEFQDISGNWIRVAVGVQDQPQVIKVRMQEVKRRYPSSRVRAVDEGTGALIDLIG